MTEPPQLPSSNELFITRKRKKWKFAHFDAWPNCFSADQVQPDFWKAYFKASQPLVVEVGAGTADLTLALAQQAPHANYVALDVKADRLYTGAKIALQHDLSNVAFVRAPARQLRNIFGPASVDIMWVTFPDPFPRKRQAKHRLTHPAFLQTYQQLLSSHGVLRFKTDNRELFLWSLEQLVAEGWRIRRLSFDLHDSSLPTDLKVTTHYERRFLAEGIAINYVEATPPKPAP